MGQPGADFRDAIRMHEHREGAAGEGSRMSSGHASTASDTAARPTRVGHGDQPHGSSADDVPVGAGNHGRAQHFRNSADVQGAGWPVARGQVAGSGGFRRHQASTAIVSVARCQHRCCQPWRVLGCRWTFHASAAWWNAAARPGSKRLPSAVRSLRCASSPKWRRPPAAAMPAMRGMSSGAVSGPSPPAQALNLPGSASGHASGGVEEDVESGAKPVKPGQQRHVRGLGLEHDTARLAADERRQRPRRDAVGRSVKVELQPVERMDAASRNPPQGPGLRGQRPGARGAAPPAVQMQGGAAARPALAEASGGVCRDPGMRGILRRASPGGADLDTDFKRGPPAAKRHDFQRIVAVVRAGT